MTVTRRYFLLAFASAIATRVFPVAAKMEPYADPEAAEKWLSAWMDAPRAVSGPLFLGRFADPIYFLREPIKWSPDQGQESLNSVSVPVGFVTDFASIPRIFWSLLPPDGIYAYAAIIHDYLYWQQITKREDADLIFKHVMEDFKVSTVMVEIIYSAVRLGGQSAWNSNAKLRGNGERRILKAFPSDPKLRWSDWRRRNDVWAI